MKKNIKRLLAAAVGICAAVAFTLAACGAKVASVSLPDELALNVGQTEQLTPEFADSDGETATATGETALVKAAQKLELVWSSDNEDVATVDDTGLVTAIADGEANISVSAGENISASVAITVSTPLEGFEIDDIEINTVSEDTEVEYAPVPENARLDEDVEITVADETIAKYENGKITPLAAGETKITVSCGTVSKTAKLIIKQAPVELSMEPVSVKVGRTAAAQVKTGLEDGVEAEVGNVYTYVIEDTSIATVDEYGTVTGVAAGETNITVENDIGQTAQATVTVSKAVVKSTASTSSSTASGSAAAAITTPDTTTPSTDTTTQSSDTGTAEPSADTSTTPSTDTTTQSSGTSTPSADNPSGHVYYDANGNPHSGSEQLGDGTMHWNAALCCFEDSNIIPCDGTNHCGQVL